MIAFLGYFAAFILILACLGVSPSGHADKPNPLTPFYWGAFKFIICLAAAVLGFIGCWV